MAGKVVGDSGEVICVDVCEEEELGVGCGQQRYWQEPRRALAV